MKKKATPRKRKGDWGIFGIRREKVGDIKKKRTKQTLKQKSHVKKLERRKELYSKQAEVYEAKARRKQAKTRAAKEWPSLPVFKVKVKKRKQGRKLSRKRRIGLI
jgi:hypothetical protein